MPVDNYAAVGARLTRWRPTTFSCRPMCGSCSHQATRSAPSRPTATRPTSICPRRPRIIDSLW